MLHTWHSNIVSIKWRTPRKTNVPAALKSVVSVAVAVGVFHSLALESDGKVAACGFNPNSETKIPEGLKLNP